MIRSNVGNVVTNGTQILSVGATTLGGLTRSLAKANQALNNKGADSASIDDLLTGGSVSSNVKQDNSVNPKEVAVDDVISDGYKKNSEQINDIRFKLRNDSAFLSDWKRSLSNPEPLDKIVKEVLKPEDGGNE